MEITTPMEFRKTLLKFAFQELTEPVRNHVMEFMKSKNDTSHKNALLSAIVANLGSSKCSIKTGQTVIVGLKDQQNSPTKNIPGTDYHHFLSSYDNDFKTIFRMSRVTINKLIRLVERRVLDSENSDLKYVSLKKRIHLTVWLMGNRESFETTAALFGVREEEVSKIFLHTCKEISGLAVKYISWPSAADRVQISRSFQSSHGFPGVVGVIGHCHLDISLPEATQEEERFWNRPPGTNGIILQVVVDDKMLIRDAYLDRSGGTNILHTFQTSPIHLQLLNNSTDTVIGSNGHLLGNSVYPQLTNLLTPFTQETNNRPITDEEGEYNEIHESVCCVVELAFEALKSRFQRLILVDVSDVDLASEVIVAACVLHNFSILHGDVF